MSESDFRILDLKHAPQLLHTVADRIWRAWWVHDDRRLTEVEAALQDVMDAEDFPFTLVALEGGRFVGTVTSIASDIAARPDLGPCLAALWVEPESRGRAIGERLSEALTHRLAHQGFERVYLSAEPGMRAYYLTRGWTMIDSDIDRDHQDVYIRIL